jgi:hypothetical protein
LLVAVRKSLYGHSGVKTPLLTSSNALSLTHACCRPPLRVWPCEHAVTKKIGGYCVCGGSMAVPALPEVRSKATCHSLCASSAAAKAIPISSTSSCPPGESFLRGLLLAHCPSYTLCMLRPANCAHSMLLLDCYSKERLLLQRMVAPKKNCCSKEWLLQRIVAPKSCCSKQWLFQKKIVAPNNGCFKDLLLQRIQECYCREATCCSTRPPCTI